jgi:glycerol uptake facilitator-like aquaporin
VKQLSAEAVAVALILVVTALSGTGRVEAGEAPLASAVVASLILGLGHGLAVWGPGSISRVHTNPWLTLVAALVGRQDRRRCLGILVVQLVTAGAGGVLAGLVRPHLAITAPLTAVGGWTILLREAVAAFGAVLIALGVAHYRDVRVPLAVGAYAAASVWLTNASTVGNPPFLVATAGSSWGHGTFPPAYLGPALLAATVGAGAGVLLAFWLFPTAPMAAEWLLFGNPAPRKHQAGGS